MAPASERSPTEEDLRDLHDQGDFATVLTLALRLYGPEILGYLVVRMQDQDAAREVFGDASEDMWRGLEAFGWRSSFRTWAYAVARHAMLAYIRNEGRRRWSDETIPEVAAKTRTATQAYLQTDVKDRVRLLREQLTPEEQELLVLRVDRGLGWEDIATIIENEGESPSDARKSAARLRKRFERTKEKLRALAERDGLLNPP